MAKAIQTYSDFSKGINSLKNPRDIESTTVPDAANVMFHEGGQISPMGNFLTASHNYTTSGTFVEGYGFIAFSSDYDLGGTLRADGVTIFAYTDTNVSGTNVYLKDSLANTLTVDLGSNASGNVVFYFADGALRISDAVKTHTGNSVYWVGYISNQYFGNTIAAWTAEINKLPAPTESTTSVGNTAYGTVGVTVSLDVTQTTGAENGVWEDEAYEFAVSFMYLGDQESKLFLSTGNINMVKKQRMKVKMLVKDATTSVPRQIGARAYVRLKDRPGESWSLLLDANFHSTNGGTRTDIFEPGYTSWTDGSTSTDWASSAYHELAAPNPLTYEVLNGHRSGDVGVLSFGSSASNCFGTATVGKSRAWVANVKYGDDSSATPVAMNDRILFTPPGKYDVFPSNYWLDIGVSDGDEFIRLAYYSEKLFAFKKQVLHIIDISGQNELAWKVGQSIDGMGVSHHGAVIEFEDGCAWVNSSGCYMYADEGLKLLSNNIGTTAWQSFVTDASLCLIGYIPVERQIIVLGNRNADGTIYIYDRNSEAWTKGTSSHFNITNMYTKNNLLYTQAFAVTAQPEITTVQCVADVDDSLDATYFDMYTAGGKTLIWFDTDDSGTSAPSGTSGYADTIEVTEVDTNDTAQSVAISLATAINSDAGGHTIATITGASNDTVTITDAANATRTNAVDGDTGFTIDTAQEGTSSSTTSLATFKWSKSTYAQNETIFTKDDDFQSPGLFKKVYSVIISYKMVAAGNDTDDFLTVQYAADGGSSYASFGSTTKLTDDSTWRKVVFTNSSPVKCQSISFKIFPSVTGGTAVDTGFWLNDINIEYRILTKATVTA